MSEPTTDSSDSRELVEAALRKWGWTCGPDFWDRYHQDPWVFNLVNALTRTTTVNETQDRLLRRLCGVADHGGPSNWRTFIDDIDERALVVALDRRGTLALSEVASR